MNYLNRTFTSPVNGKVYVPGVDYNTPEQIKTFEEYCSGLDRYFEGTEILLLEHTANNHRDISVAGAMYLLP